jgi:hypothetical protein
MWGPAPSPNGEKAGEPGFVAAWPFDLEGHYFAEVRAHS